MREKGSRGFLGIWLGIHERKRIKIKRHKLFLERSGGGGGGGGGGRRLLQVSSKAAPERWRREQEESGLTGQVEEVGRTA